MAGWISTSAWRHRFKYRQRAAPRSGTPSTIASSARSVKNWAGQPLRSYETILNHIRTTTTKTGLRASAHLIDREYPKGVKISDAQFATIALERHETQPLRNYTIHPRC